MPSWAIVPIHLITKFSSSLFVLVFGITLAVAFAPSVGTPAWPKKRLRLLTRGVVVLFWYKLLTVIEMLHLSEPYEIIEALEYKRFPVFTEILGFYGIALLWVPFALGVWQRIPRGAQMFVPIAFGVLWYQLSQSDFLRGNIPLRAILLEHEGLYVWGQLSRGALVFVGLLVGGMVLRWREKSELTAFACALLAAAFGAAFLFATSDADRAAAIQAIARNAGKHPPELRFMLFSLMGAFGILSCAFLGGNRLASWLRPVTIIGKDALGAFAFHIFVIFLFYRYLFSFWRLVTYEDALVLTGALMVMTALWVRAKQFVGKNS